MAYIGPEPNPGQNREVDDISSGFNGGTASFTLQVNGQNVSPGSANAIIVSLGGVIQNPGTDYTVSASTITFTTNPASGLSFFGLVLGQGIDAVQPADASVTAAKLASPLDLPDNQKIRFGTGNDIEIYSDGSNGYITHTDSGGDPLYISSQNDIRLRVANTEEGVKIKSNGEVELYHNDTLQCETSANGLAFPSGKGIDFAATADSSATGATDSSELFNDYEEGTWTPIYQNNDNSPTFDVQTGRYTKVGRFVYCTGRLSVQGGTALSTTDGSGVNIGGLPFVGNNDHHACLLTLGRFTSILQDGGASTNTVRFNGDSFMLMTANGNEVTYTECNAFGDLTFAISYQQ